MVSTTSAWWETIFTGVLSIGINEEKIHLLENEEFLYLKENSLPQEEKKNEPFYDD